MRSDDRHLGPAPSIGAAARRDWRWYAPGWVYPLVLLAWHTAGAAGAGEVPFALLAVLQAAAFCTAGSRWPRGRATYRKFVVLGMLVPLAAWAVAVYVRLAVLAVLGRAGLVRALGSSGRRRRACGLRVCFKIG